MQHSIGAIVHLSHPPTGDQWTGVLIDVQTPHMTSGIASIDVLVDDVIITLEPSMDGMPWFDLTVVPQSSFLHTLINDTFEVALD